MDKQECYYKDLLKRYMLGIVLAQLLEGGITIETARVIPCRFKINPRESDEFSALYDEIMAEWNAFAKEHNLKLNQPPPPRTLRDDWR